MKAKQTLFKLDTPSGVYRLPGIQAPAYKKRFLIKYGDRLQVKPIEEVSFFYAEGKTVYLVSKINQLRYIIDHSLEQLEKQLLDPLLFFRINRKYIISLNDIANLKSYLNNRIKVELHTGTDQELIVSRDRLADFKSWLDQ